MDEEAMIIGYCTVCGDEITDDMRYYCDSEGNLFCTKECVLEHFDIMTMEG